MSITIISCNFFGLVFLGTPQGGMCLPTFSHYTRTDLEYGVYVYVKKNRASNLYDSYKFVCFTRFENLVHQNNPFTIIYSNTRG